MPIDHDLLSSIGKILFEPVQRLIVKTNVLQFCDQKTVSNGVKGLAEVNENSSNGLSLIHFSSPVVNSFPLSHEVSQVIINPRKGFCSGSESSFGGVMI